MPIDEQQETLHFLDYWRVIQSRKEVVIAVFLLVVVTGIMVTYAMPKYYRASCVIAVEKEAPDVDVWNQSISSFDPLFLHTQFEIIQSRPIIEDTIRKLNLTDKLGKAYGYDNLPQDEAIEKTFKVFANNMKVQQYRDTNLIEIRVDMAEPKETAPREAAAAANTIALVYRLQNMTRFKKEKEGALAAMHEALGEQEKKVDVLETKVEEVRQKYKIDVIAPFAGGSITLDSMALTRLEESRIMLMVDLEVKKALWNKIRSMNSEELLEVAPRLVGDQALAVLVAARDKADIELSALEKIGLGQRHPEVMRFKTMVRELDAKIRNALKSLKTGVEADYDTAVAKVEAFSEILEVKRATERTHEAGGYRVFEKAQEELSHARKIRDALELRYLQERIELRIPRTAVEVIEMAKAAKEKDFVRPNFILNFALSLLVGLGSGIGLAYFIEYLDTSLKTVEDIERYMNVAVIGVIPQKVQPFVEAGADSRYAEPYRVLRANIQFSDKMSGGKSLCITSGSVGEGKSLTIFNLGYICAQLGDRTLIVDSDLHRPRQHKILGLSNEAGLANVLVGEIGVEDAVIGTRIPNLDFLPSGKLTAGVHGLLDTSRMKALVKDLYERYDQLLFDAPPMIGVSDASLLAREVDGVLLVVQHRKYPRTVSRRAKDMVENVGANLIGVVLNNINVSRDYSYYYHHYYYSYPQAPSQEVKS